RDLGKAIERCKRGEATGIIVAWQDRLSRENGAATAEVWEELERIGARLVAAAEGLDTASGDHEMLFTIKAAIAREQWKRHKANWSNAQRDAVERGVHPCAWVPAGYLRNVIGRNERTGRDKHGPLLIDPKVAPVIREMYELRASGGSWSECAQLLERHEIRNHVGTVHWPHRSIQKLVRNRTYLGEAFHGEFVNPEAHEAIVDPPLWRAAQP